MNIRQLIEHLENNYDPETEIAYSLIEEEDVFWALQNNGIISEDQQYDEYEKDNPLGYYMLKYYYTPTLLDGYDFTWSFFEYAADNINNYMLEDDEVDARKEVMISYVMETNPDYTRDEAEVYVSLLDEYEPAKK